MSARSRRCWLLLAVVAAAVGAVAADAGGPTTTTSSTLSASKVFTTDDGQPVNSYFRTQEEIAATDISTTSASGEFEVPGLAPSNYKKAWRSIPNVEHFSPFITTAVPMLPTMAALTDALNVHFPKSWPLAGSDGEPKKDYINTWFRVFARAALGLGPKPPVHATILIPSHEAYARLAHDMHAHSGLNVTAVKDPAKAVVMLAAIHHQLLSNLLVIAAPNLTSAVNGSVMMTAGKVKLTLLVKPDGSRHLVSNTTSVKVLAADLGCPRCGSWTYNIVDGFVVPKMSPTLPKPDPLFTAEAMAKWPQEFKDWQEAWAAAPKAAWDMPGAMWHMVVRQLPQEHQDKLDKLGKLLHPKLSLLPTVSITKRAP